MDAPISSSPSLQDSPPPHRYRIYPYLVVFAFLVLILGGVLWYRSKKEMKQAAPVFNPATQFVPEGATPLEVSETLAKFGFSKPLPFFEERNVVQSLGIDVTSTSSVETYISYRILGQDTASVRSAFNEYFKKLGWKMANTKEGAPLYFYSNARQTVFVSFFEAPSVQNKDHAYLTVILTAR